MIGDDCAVIRDALRKLLEKQDDWVVVGEAQNGKEIVEKAEELKPDIVVLDLSMPVMNGIDAARELRRCQPSLPFIMFTAFNDICLMDLALLAGANAVITKSEAATLVRKLHHVLGSA